MKKSKILILAGLILATFCANLVFVSGQGILSKTVLAEAEMGPGTCLLNQSTYTNYLQTSLICGYDDDCIVPITWDGIDAISNRCIPGGTQFCFDHLCTPYCINDGTKQCIPDDF